MIDDKIYIKLQLGNPKPQYKLISGYFTSKLSPKSDGKLLGTFKGRRIEIHELRADESWSRGNRVDL